jgi:hypothetical protein
VAQLERDLIAERVRNGLANAKAKGIRIGRLKTRDSDLIRKLRAKGMTFRDCAKIANCSTGAIGAEMRALKAENIAKEKKRIEEEALLPKLELEKSAHHQNSILDDHQNRPFDATTEDTKLELDFVKF